MLELRPNCEWCDKDLPPEAEEARFCSYECTFCADCAEDHLANVCPNCGGGFVARPIRPATAWPAGGPLRVGRSPTGRPLPDRNHRRPARLARAATRIPGLRAGISASRHGVGIGPKQDGARRFRTGGSALG